jgi:alpha/beta superfamily hydrolase
VLQGTADDICPLSALEAEFPRWAEPKRLVTIEGGTHFFDRQLAALGDAILQALAAEAAGRTS